MGNCLDWPLRTVSPCCCTLPFSASFIALVLATVEMGQSGYLGSYQDSIVSVTQNCVLVSNILGQSCVFLSRGMAKCRQAVRKGDMVAGAVAS
uniref:Uncharacterized protein n=1 Tax=Oreochromis niloticus TaxID=8128 RepID=A0A669EC46_ORENI